MSMRVFVAIELNAEIRARLEAIQRDLQAGVDGVKWVAPHNVHLTLAFIGDVPDTMPAVLGETVDRAAAASGPFTCTLAGVGVFGRPGAPRVVWAGVSHVPAGLAAVHAVLNAKLSALGLAVDTRPFHPHLTLGRVKSPRGCAALLAHVRRLADVHVGTLHVDSLALIRSVLTPAGPVYTALHHAALSSV
jgi:RNA 2',3'-cyclic 3'-phosphodiesterase